MGRRRLRCNACGQEREVPEVYTCARCANALEYLAAWAEEQFA